MRASIILLAATRIVMPSVWQELIQKIKMKIKMHIGAVLLLAKVQIQVNFYDI